MGKRRKRTTNSRKRSSSSSGSFLNADLMVILLVVLGIISFLVIYRAEGQVGKVLSPALGGALRKNKIYYSIWYFWGSLCCLQG